MNRKNTYTFCIALILISIIASGCTAAKAGPCPTVAPLACPTAPASPQCPTSALQACPTAAAQAALQQSAWRKTVGSLANLVITIDSGDKCTLEVKHPLSSDILFYEIVVNDQAYQNYLVGIETLTAGKTLEDLKALPQYMSGEPNWVSVDLENVVDPMSRTFAKGSVDPVKGPLYITCAVEDPTSLKIIGHLGPVEVPSE